MLIDGMVSLSEIQEHLQINMSEHMDVVQTLSGLIMHLLKNIPKEGQFVEYEGWVFEVVDMDGNRIDKVFARLIETVTLEVDGRYHENSDR
jgi:putative hemolysin